MGACFDLSIHYDLAVKNCFYRYKHSILTDGTIPCQVDTYKNENTVFLIRPNRGNIPPRFGHFF